MKKTNIFLCAMSLMIVGTSSIAVMTNKRAAKSTFGGDDVVWNHYSGVAATLDTKGIKEYWVNCSTHETVFTAPESANIVNKGEPSQAFIDSLASTDSRLLKSTYKILTFDDASDADLVISKRNNFATKEIVDDPETGSKCLAVTYKDGTGDFKGTREYLDLAFSDPNVVAINYDLKGTVEQTNLMVKTTTGNPRFEGNGSVGYGIQQYWKTFSFTRANYEDAIKSYGDTSWTWWAASTTATYYIDNIRPSTKVATIGGFESGRLRDNTASDGAYYVYGIDESVISYTTWSFAITGASNFSRDYENKTEGHYSLKFHRTASVTVNFMAQGITNSMSANDLLYFDIRVSTTLNAYVTTQNGAGSALDVSPNQYAADNWYTAKLTKSQIGNGGKILILVGSPEFDCWIDNIRIESQTSEYECESDALSQSYYSGASANEYSYGKRSKAATSPLIRLVGNASVASAKISYARKSSGNGSIMITRTRTAEMAFYFGSEIINEVKTNGKTLSFDVYSTIAAGGSNITNGMRGTFGDSYIHQAYKWVTYTINADGMTADGRGFIIAGSTQGTWFIDNLVINNA